MRHLIVCAATAGTLLSAAFASGPAQALSGALPAALNGAVQQDTVKKVWNRPYRSYGWGDRPGYYYGWGYRPYRYRPWVWGYYYGPRPWGWGYGWQRRGWYGWN
jgi:hypothetical protein